MVLVSTISLSSLAFNVSADSSLSNTASKIPSYSNPCVQSYAEPVSFLIQRAEMNPAFVGLADDHDFELSAFALQVSDNSCSPFLIFTNSTFGSIQVFFNSNNSVVKSLFYPPTTRNEFSGSNNIWSGYEQNSLTVRGNIPVDAAQVDFTVESPTLPPYNNSNCCATAFWVGLGDASGASDGVLAQAGVAVASSYQKSNLDGGVTPVFWYEQLSAGPNFWTSTCLVVSNGDYVNVTMNFGSFQGGSYDTQYVYGDNDPSSSCAIYIWTNYFLIATPTWSYYILEAPSLSTCSSGPGVCQIIEWSTDTFTAEYIPPGNPATWLGFDTTTGTHTVNSWYINQGYTNTAVSISSSSQFVQTWKTSEQS